MASADLGGLGAKEGSPLTYTWTAPSLVPQVLPWLAVLVLLAFKANRRAQTWWIGLPLVGVAALNAWLPSALSFLPSTVMDLFLEVASTLGFGVAAVWLLAPYLVRTHRFLTFLCILPTLAAFSLLVFVVRQDWGEDGAAAVVLPGFMGLMLGVLAISGALALAGLTCRRRFRPLGLSLWLMAWVVAVWLVATSPFFVFAALASGGRAPWREFFGGVLTLAGVCYAALLPFLVLSFANPGYRQRLKDLLHLRPEAPPLILPPASVSSPAT